MLTLVRRIIRRLAGLPPYGTPEVTPRQLAEVWERLEAIDRGRGDQIEAYRAETQRALLRMRAELDAVLARLDAAGGDDSVADAGQPADATARSTSDS